MQVGVLASVVGGRDELERFERARSVGCTGIEVMLLRRHLRDAGTPAALRAAQAATGLELPTFVLDEHNFGGIAASDGDVATAAAEEVRIAIAWAAELGVGAVLIPFFVEAEIRDDAAFERAVAAFRELCPLAAARGVVLAYEGTLPAPGLGAAQLGGELLDRSLADDGYAAEGRTVLEARGLRIPALSGYRNLVAPDASARAANLDHLRRCLELAPTLGTWVVATGSGTRSTAHDWADDPDHS